MSIIESRGARRRIVNRVTAANGSALTLAASSSCPITASVTSRTLGGPVIRYGEYGRTSAGLLKVAPGALQFPDDLSRVKLTREHERDAARGHLVAMADDGQQVRVRARVSDGPEGDAALQEAADKTRDGFSFDVVDAVIDGDTITSALVIAIGQVGIPAFDDMRIDSIAAAHTQQEGKGMTEEQRQRLAELQAKDNLSAEERAELAQLQALAATDDAQAADDGAQAADDGAAAATDGGNGGQSATASVPGVPGGVPRRRSPATTRPRGTNGALRRFTDAIAAAYQPGANRAAVITAALADITSGDVSDIISPPAWSGELWSGLQHEPEFTPLLNSGELTNWKGEGWRWVTKPEMKDYAGNKAAIPSDPVSTEPSGYEAARMAVGHDIDRKFYDFPDSAFLTSYAEACRESWSVKLDAKVRAYIVANAVPVTGPDGGDPDTDPDPIVMPTLLKAASRGARAVKRNTNGARATFVVASDNDFDTLMDVTQDDVPAFLELFGVDPKNFTSSPDVADGTVIVGTKQAATVRTLPGSPIRADAQHIANGGIDTAFFGYWAIEEHHESGIVSVQFVAA